MNVKYRKIIRISMIIPTVFLLLWGLFIFSPFAKESIVSENGNSQENKDGAEAQAGENKINPENLAKDNISDSGDENPDEKSQPSVAEDLADEKKDSEEPVEEVSGDKIKNNFVFWGFSVSSARKIDTIVLHSSYNALGGDEYDADKLIEEYRQYGVSPHYLIDREGNIHRLVEDKNIAYHAGESETPDGRTNVNNFSIGIEIINNKTDDYQKAQYDSANWLIGEIKKNYNIKYVLGHNEIAPERKTDPWNIDWEKIER